ncbi:MAG: PQQ-dependent sugar dehydrogenase [Acidobacteria bacterium]|nr:PQQ-dependent sugar dehydrogenase [Acidobacteriota bacterium]
MRALIFFAFALNLAAAEFPQIRLVPVAGGLENPLHVTHAGDGSGRLFIVEQPGRVRILKNGALVARPFLDIVDRVRSGGERGLLSVVFPPDYARKRYFYVNYTDTPGGHTVVARYRTLDDPDLADRASEEQLLYIQQPYANHNGGGMTFGPDGFLYIGMGDGGSAGDPQNNAQRPEVLLGKMLRIDVESGQRPYAVPPSNPFAGDSRYRAEIWALGLRNPWRFSFDRETRDLWIADVGQNRAEEVNFQPAASRGGENYGWHTMEGLRCFNPPAGCDQSGLTLPVVEYTRSDGISVTGGFVYRGGSYPDLRGIYLYGDYGSGNIWGLRREEAGWENRLLLRSGLAISSFGEDEGGELYVANHRGDVYLVTAGAPAVDASAVVNAASFAPGLSPGSIATLFGRGIVTMSGITTAATFPLPLELQGTSLTINGVPAPLYAVARAGGQEQINFQAPYEISGSRTATLVVTSQGQASLPVTVAVEDEHPGLFVLPGGGAAALDSAGRVISRDNPARRGQPVSIFATGLGRAANEPATGQPAPSSPPAAGNVTPQVTIGAAAAPVGFSGLAPGFAGLYQINVTVPLTAATGDVDLVVALGSAAAPPVKLPVQ